MIDIYVNDIRNSIQNKSYFSALALALTLPDICGMVAYSKNKTVAERYVEWCDEYLCPSMYNDENDEKRLTGEAIYNLRNTFLHQGSPAKVADKMKEDNRIDKFLLIIGEAKYLLDSSISFKNINDKVIHRTVIVNISFLCEEICVAALNYYNEKKNNFTFSFNAMLLEDLMQPVDAEDKLSAFGDIIDDYAGYVIKEKRNTKNNTLDDANTMSDLSKGNEQKQKKKVVKRTPSKRESQVRSFFGIHFKKKIYTDNKEEIIQAVLKSKTKQQVNTRLMKIYPSEIAGEVYRKLMPLIKEMPGK